MSFVRPAIIAGLAVLAVVPAALGSAARTVSFSDTLPANGSSSVTITVRRPAAFRVLLRAPTVGRTRLYLLGRTAPGGGPLLDTRGTACEGAAGSFYCRGSYEPLPRGTYTFRVHHAGARAAHVELTVRW